MDPGIIGVFIPIVAIIMGCSIAITAVWTKHKQKIAEMQIDTTAKATAEKAAQYSSQVQKLEDRVQVLERIVTDRGYDIATQIEAQRDTREVEDRDSGVQVDVGNKERV